ncbi:hypothetical protein LG197_23455 [Pseudomonas asiatica]|uniref:hypothetical protein n=1 Tax=Pseudomonas asiatica TaxID=2219225 RepID=UPI002368A090|nr:hypothetical protein [Pseudomonas asiatica]WDM87537.1 hypothetical protein LG197_23455 [Pseudomonas asiatica]
MDVLLKFFVWDAAYKWLLLEALLPLVGTALLYWALQGCFRITQTAAFTFKWGEAIDSMGWLYGAAVIAIQAGVKGWGLEYMGLIPGFCWFIALACSLLLIAAICSKAADPTWQPGRPMKLAATLLTALVLIAGFQIQNVICCSAGGTQ